MSETIHERTDNRGVTLRVDRAASILRGVKLLGLASKNGRRYLPSALVEAAHLYERAKVNVNHAAAGPLAPRSYHDRLGVIRNVRLRETEGLFGDLHFNPKHAVAEQLLWDAENAAENVGLSHNVIAVVARRGEEAVVERITDVQSVDLVADPATTQGLFEGAAHGANVDARNDVANERAQNGREFAEQHDSMEVPRRTRRERVYELLAENDLPLPGAKDEHAKAITSPVFVAALWEAPDDAAARRLIEDRAAAIHAARKWREPARSQSTTESRDQYDVERAAPFAQRNNLEDFVAAITC